MRRRRPRTRHATGARGDGEAGMTLIELMAALVILSLVVLAVLALLATMVKASDLANRQTEAEALAIGAADYLKGEGFLYDTAADCTAGYQAALATYQGSYMPAASYGATVTVAYGTRETITPGDALEDQWQPFGAAPDPCNQPGRRAVKLTTTVTSADGAVSRTREIVMRCDLQHSEAVCA